MWCMLVGVCWHSSACSPKVLRLLECHMLHECPRFCSEGNMPTLTALVTGILQANMEVINANPKLAGIDLERILTPAAQLRPGAAQRCVQKQARPAH